MSYQFLKLKTFLLLTIRGLFRIKKKKLFLSFLLKILGEGEFVNKKRTILRVTDWKERN